MADMEMNTEENIANMDMNMINIENMAKVDGDEYGKHGEKEKHKADASIYK